VSACFLTIKSGAQLIFVSERTLRRWIADRKIRSYRFGGIFRIKKDGLLNFGEVRETIDEKTKKIFLIGD